MTKQETQSLFDQITGVLEQKHIKQAIDLLRFSSSILQNWQLNEKLDQTEETYQSMLRYLSDGISDPERDKVHRNLIRSLYHIIDQLVFQIKMKDNPSLFYEKRRTLHLSVPETASQLIQSLETIDNELSLQNVLDNPDKNTQTCELESQKEELGRKIFALIWLGNSWTKDDKLLWNNVLNQQESDHLLALMITGLTLHLLEHFDEQRASLLFASAENENPEVRERALTGIVLFLRKYDKRLPLYPELTERLNQLAEDPAFLHRIRHIVLQFILSRDTEKITQKITTEVFPEMMQKIGQKMQERESLSDFGIADDDDKNPEWQNIIEESGVQDKLQEISELQMEGADVMHSSFIHLKHYPLFNEISNWFIPFYVPENVRDNDELLRLAKVLQRSTMLCNSDKFSFFLSLAFMPEKYRKMMINQFTAETDAHKEMVESELPDMSQKIDYRARQYIQDLYRFYKLHPRKSDFEDIFAAPVEFYQTPSIFQLIQNQDSLMAVGEHYFHRNYWKEAIEIFDKLLETDPNNDVLHQKKGYALQQSGHLDAALESYQKAELLNANHSWTIKKLAHLHRLLKNPQEALLYYKKAEQLNPNNLTIQFNIGRCLLESKEYEQALKQYFKVEYLANNKEKAWRAIAWISFLLRKYNQAADYYQRLIDGEPGVADYLNAGHVQLAMNQPKEAIHYYALSYQTAKQSLAEFTEMFQNDVPELIESGVNQDIIPLILDKVFYE
ncbi:MAG: tetratricopeptide repeat protein [Dysgonamonadaceae bacterium]|jgi:tetratricopeptide (TPR) repeat protein|nr:tetratricopeptide repeat protein [Dysgonamonadaceae bacterium]